MRQVEPTPGFHCRRILGVVLTFMLVGLADVRAEDQPSATGATDTMSAASRTVWPQHSEVDGRSVTVYEPQPERLTGNVLSARAALNITPSGGEPVFGAMWMTLRLDIDREQRTAGVASVTVERVRFPDGEPGGVTVATLIVHLERTLRAVGLEFALDDLIATLEEPPTEQADYNLAAPRILVRTAPTELVVFDGPPRFETAGGVTLAVNTPAFVCVEPGGVWWLRLENGWLRAPGSTGPWTFAPAPAAVAAAATVAGVAIGPASADELSPPDVIIATTPTELVEFAGEPQWTPIADTGLLAAENCDHDVFIDTATRRYWLLTAGRWFSTDLLIDGSTWAAVAPDALPAGFTAIPATSRWARVRVHVSGTEEARKAAVDAAVPQTARIPRSATITVTYDGEPRFVAIPASDAEWAENSSFAVFRTPGPRYWCCSEGVWYEAAQADGPWSVATEIPGSLQRIPADNPHHNVTYVHIYESQPDYVWTGYTAGYTNCYIYHGCPIYGSGWYWSGYYGHTGYACPRPLTWGVRVVYNPWYCSWGVASGYRRVRTGGVVFVGQRTNCGWWGPVRQAPPPVHRSRPTYAWRDDTIVRRPDPRDVTAVSTRDAALYRRVPGAQLPTRTSRPEPVRTLPGDPGQSVFVRNDGTLVRRSNSGQWQERNDRAWTDVTPRAVRETTPEPDRRLPRVATRQPAPERRQQQEQPRSPRSSEGRPVEPPTTRPMPPPDRPRPESRDRVQEPPRRRPDEDRGQPPVTLPPSNDQPRQEPPSRQRPEEPPRRRSDEDRGQPPVTVPPPSDQPRQEPPARQRPEELPRRRSDEDRGQPPVTVPPPSDRPRQEPPARQRVEEPPRPERRPSDPTTTRPPVERQPSSPPPRLPDTPRPRQPEQQPAETPRSAPPAPPRRTDDEAGARQRAPEDRSGGGGLRPARPDQSVRPSPPSPPTERDERSPRNGNGPDRR